MSKRDVCVLIQPSEKEFFWISNIISGMKKMANRQEYNLKFIDSDYFDKLESGTPVLIVGYTYRWVRLSAECASDNGLNPIVVGACLHPELKEKCNGIEFELSEIVKSVIMYLKDAGCSRIALLGANRSSIADRVKEQTVKAISSTDVSVFVCDDSLSLCVEEFLKSYEREKFDGVLCVNDTVAIYLINLLKTRGIRVPEDIKIAGIGNSYLGQRHEVSITSVNFDYFEMGKQSIRLWRYIRKNEGEMRVTVSLPCELIVRGSTGHIENDEQSELGETTENGNERYYYDPDVQSIIRAEAFLGECDELDKEILYCIINNDTYGEMADKLRLTDRAIKYRVAKMIKKFGAEDREEIAKSMKNLLGTEEQ
ncbi:MAG: LacI family DNA-binding transcriptional regulator [Acutalibacteraceae bacterium]|nr:LacI family DNA-binding transcriptional regulator [Acutalibacteraceae bacterium]